LTHDAALTAGIHALPAGRNWGRMRKLVVKRGAIPAVARFSKDHFEWLALYQCGNLSLDSILRRAQHVASTTTISKGIHSAATLAAIAVRPKSKLKDQ
jgi:hypothetical protein